MEILQHIWGSTPEGEGIILYTMRNSRGSEVQLCNIGASIVSVKFADRNGVIDDVALGYMEPTSYIGDGAASGKSVGRVAGRIARGQMTIDVVIENGVITDVVLGENHETNVVMDRAFPVIRERILTANTADVDSVSAATFSSYAVKTAIADAMKQAGLEAPAV